jgi:hypothetical protein
MDPNIAIAAALDANAGMRAPPLKEEGSSCVTSTRLLASSARDWG